MNNILTQLSGRSSVKSAIRANWEAYHYCLAQSPNVELSIGRYLTWLITDLPDHFMNLVVCNQLPAEGIDGLIENTLDHFRSLNIKRLSWLTQVGVPFAELNDILHAHGLKFRGSFATEMAVDLALLPECLPAHPDLRIVRVEDEHALKQWIQIASIGFKISDEFEQVWHDIFVDTIPDSRFQTYLALLNGKPVGTSQLFISEGVAGIYNVKCLPEARGKGIGSAVTLAPLLKARQIGCQIGVLQASQKGYNVYRRLGFQDFGKLSLYLWENDRSVA
jgi:GNAT superfamily N-acetyltransferase